MKKILFIAYQFPPQAGPGVHRSLQLIRSLREFGYEPVVLTIDEKSIDESGSTKDEKLLLSLPEGIEIIRTPSHQPVRFVKRMMKLKVFRFFWYFFYPLFWEPAARWPRAVMPTARSIVKKYGIELVYTTSGPFSSMLIGRKLKKELGIKWVADLRDPFTDAYAWDFPSVLHWKMRRQWEKRIFPQADKLILNTPEVRRLYIKRKLTSTDRSVCITNGY